MVRLNRGFLGLFVAVSSAAAPTRAVAELPQPVRAMVEAAIATGDPQKVSAVVEVARQTNPDDVDEIDALHDAFKSQQAELAAAEEKRKLQEVRQAGLFDRWTGRGEIGAFNSDGNSDSIGVTLSLSLTRTGVDWSHRLNLRADYQRTNGVTSREQYFVSYEPRFQISKRVFTYGLGQLERNTFQGFGARYSMSGGLGFQILDNDKINLSAKAGPAWRSTKFVDGGSESRIAGLVGLDFDWSLTERLKLTHDANAVAETGGQATVVVDSANTSINLVTGLEAKISNQLTARLSYTLEHDSNPPPDAVRTDTLSRFTVIYGF